MYFLEYIDEGKKMIAKELRKYISKQNGKEIYLKKKCGSQLPHLTGNQIEITIPTIKSALYYHVADETSDDAMVL